MTTKNQPDTAGGADKTDSEILAEKIVSHAQRLPDPPTAADKHSIAAEIADLLAKLQKDREMRKWALELACKSTTNGEHAIRLANDMYNFSNSHIDKVSALFR